MRAPKGHQDNMRTPPCCLIQDISTMWNSIFFMIECLLEQRWPVTAVLADTSVTKSSDRYLVLKSEQWIYLKLSK